MDNDSRHPVSGWRASGDESAAGPPSTGVDVWDHDFARVAHGQHRCAICGTYNGLHGSRGEPRTPSQSAAGAPSPDTRPQTTRGTVDPWPGYTMVNLSLVRECMDCGSLVIDPLVHDKWHDMRG